MAIHVAVAARKKGKVVVVRGHCVAGVNAVAVEGCRGHALDTGVVRVGVAIALG